MTCAFVRIYPSEVIITPLPPPLPLVFFVIISTTLGSIFCIAAFDEPSLSVGSSCFGSSLDCFISTLAFGWFSAFRSATIATQVLKIAIAVLIAVNVIRTAETPFLRLFSFFGDVNFCGLCGEGTSLSVSLCCSLPFTASVSHVCGSSFSFSQSGTGISAASVSDSAFSAVFSASAGKVCAFAVFSSF